MEETKAEYNPAAYGMNRAEEQVMTYPSERYAAAERPRYKKLLPKREQSKLLTILFWIRTCFLYYMRVDE